MSELKEALAPFRTAIILLVILVVVSLGLKVGVPLANELMANNSPVTGLEASCNNTYSTSQEIVKTDFTVYAVHENGKKNKLSAEEYELSSTVINPVGDTTMITVEYTQDNTIRCEAAVSVLREKVVSFQCGYPDYASVNAVLYTNGELCFEGEGEVLVWEEGRFPWLDYEEMEDYPIKAVTFQEKVLPTNLNYFFEGIESLTYVSKIPVSVRTMSKTFADCISLTAMPDWTACEQLLNITSCFDGCLALNQTCPVPASVELATRAFAECEQLDSVPDMSASNSLKYADEMFNSCKRLHSVMMPPYLDIATNMYANCINLQDMPEIPQTVTDMTNCFGGCISLVHATGIPESVMKLDQCFAGCEMLTGGLVIDCETDSYDAMFEGAALATRVNLTGKSRILALYAATSGNDNFTVNGKAPEATFKDYAEFLEQLAAAEANTANSSSSEEEEEITEEEADSEDNKESKTDKETRKESSKDTKSTKTSSKETKETKKDSQKEASAKTEAKTADKEAAKATTKTEEDSAEVEKTSEEDGKKTVLDSKVGKIQP